MQYNKGIFWYFLKSFTKLRNLKEFRDENFCSADNAEILWDKSCAYWSVFPGVERREERFPTEEV